MAHSKASTEASYGHTAGTSKASTEAQIHTRWKTSRPQWWHPSLEQHKQETSPSKQYRSTEGIADHGGWHEGPWHLSSAAHWLHNNEGGTHVATHQQKQIQSTKAAIAAHTSGITATSNDTKVAVTAHSGRPKSCQ